MKIIIMSRKKLGRVSDGHWVVITAQFGVVSPYQKETKLRSLDVANVMDALNSMRLKLPTYYGVLAFVREIVSYHAMVFCSLQE